MTAPADPAAFERARSRFLEGLRCHQDGRFDAAVGHYLASLEDMPTRSSTLTNLAAARLALGQAALALNDARAALAADPGNREAMLHEATALAELARLDEALPAFRRLAVLEPDHPGVWMAIGNLLMEQSDTSAAAQAFQTALNAGADPDLATFHLAAARAQADAPLAPLAPPSGYVQSLFDRYAADFDQHLGQLGYDAPGRLVDGLPADHDGQPRRFTGALDLGCGTGLCAPLLRRRVERLVGVDLSAQMLDRARDLGLYDQLDHADIAEWLAVCDERFDLVVAADVFIYVGALDAVFSGVARVLEADGVFAFSLERPHAGLRTPAGFVLQPSKRYAHTLAYVRALSQHHGMRVVASHAGAVRREREGVIEGTYVFAARG